MKSGRLVRQYAAGAVVRGSYEKRSFYYGIIYGEWA